MTVHRDNKQVPHLIHGSTLPIYGTHDDYVLIQDRSGVLVRLADRLFVLTAVHDLNEFVHEDGQLRDGRKLFISTEDVVHHDRKHRGPETVELEIERVVLMDEATIDVAAIEISHATAELVASKKTFVSIDDMRSVSLPPEGNYVVFGHPFALTKSGNAQDAMPKVTSPMAWFDTHPLPSTVRPNHDPEKQVVFHLPHDPELVKRADDDDEPMKGFSGCGIWHVSDDQSVQQGEAKLIGIFCRQCASKEYIVGTSLKCVLDSLAATYPDITQDASMLMPLTE